MKRVLIVAGEASGDIHASNLIKQVKKIDPSVNFLGMGGNLMKDAGAEILYHINEFGVVGLFEVLKKVPALKKVQKHFLKIVDEEKIDLVVLVDYPGFNLRLAKKLSKRSVKVLYYILPQVWAWGRGRIEKMAKWTDAMASIIPFEPEIFRAVGGNCHYIGHPLMDHLVHYNYDQEVLDKLNLEKGFKVLILPGSRMNEIERIFPIMVRISENLAHRCHKKNIKFFISRAETIPEEEITLRMQKHHDFKFEIFTGNLYEYLKTADFAIVTSGTATLETGLFEVPMVLLYKTSWLTFWLAKLLVKVENIGLVNIIAGRRIVREYVQFINTEKVAEYIFKRLNHPDKLEVIRDNLKVIKEKLGDPGASENGAKLLLGLLK